MSAALVTTCAVLGLVIGSFLNVVIYRVPRHLSLIRPGSACPSCSTPIKPYDNIPVVSWIVLRGRCRACGAPISPRYLAVEVLTGGLFAAAAAKFGPHWPLPAYLAGFAGLIAIALIDLERLVIPKSLAYVTLGAVTLLFVASSAATGHWHNLGIGAACAASWLVAFFIFNLLAPRFLGFGDVRFAPSLGLLLGWLGVGYALLGFFLSNLIGAVIGVALIAAGRASRDQPIAYGFYLAAGTIVTVFAGHPLLNWLASP